MKLPGFVERMPKRWRTAVILTVGVSVFAGIGYIGYTYGKDWYLKIKGKEDDNINENKTNQNGKV